MKKIALAAWVIFVVAIVAYLLLNSAPTPRGIDVQKPDGASGFVPAITAIGSLITAVTASYLSIRQRQMEDKKMAIELEKMKLELLKMQREMEKKE